VRTFPQPIRRALSASNAFQHPTHRPNELWQSDFTYLQTLDLACERPARRVLESERESRIERVLHAQGRSTGDHFVATFGDRKVLDAKAHGSHS
jgi:hypothetical protein